MCIRDSPGKAQISGHQATLARRFSGDAHGGAVQRFDVIFQAHGGQFIAAGIKRERLEHVRPRLAKFDVQLAQSFRVRQRYFRCERSRTHPAALLELQQIASIAQHHPFLQPFQNSFSHRSPRTEFPRVDFISKLNQDLLRKSRSTWCAAL